MNKIRCLLLCCVVFLTSTLYGCATNTIVAYDGSRLTPDRVAILELNRGRITPDEWYVTLKSVDNKEVLSKGIPNSVELLPGNHSLHLEYVLPSSQGAMVNMVVGNRIISYYSPGYSGGILAEGTVKFNAEAGHKYVLEVDPSTRILKGGGLRCTIEDLTTIANNGGRAAEGNNETQPIRGNIVYSFPPKRSPIPFSLSEIPKDRAVVCFYREWKLLSGRADFYIYEKKPNIETLPNGSFFYHVTTPGSHVYKITFGGQSPVTDVTVDLVPGVVSYLRASVYSGKLTLINEAEALKEIRGLEVVK